MSVREQRRGQPRPSQRDERVDEDLVPEDVAVVGLAVQAPRGDAGVEVGVDRVERLQHVEGVEVQREGLVARRMQLDRELRPEPLPRELVLAKELVERRGGEQAVGGVVRRGEHGAVPEVPTETTFSMTSGIPAAASTVNSWATAPSSCARNSRRGATAEPPSGDARACRHGDADGGALGLGLEHDGVGRELAQFDGPQVAVRARQVIGHVRVRDATVDAGSHDDRPRPADGHDRHPHGREVGVGLRQEAIAAHSRHAPRVVAERHPAAEDAVPHVELLPEVEQVRGIQRVETEPVAAVATELHLQPVRRVDHLLVGSGHTIGGRRDDVVHPGEVRSRVVHAVGPDSSAAPRVPQYPLASAQSASLVPSSSGS